MGIDLTSPHGWRAVGASVAGTSHVTAGEPCADACRVRVLPVPGSGSLLVAVAADGAGSCARGADGARIACEAVLDSARRWVSEDGCPDGGLASLSGFSRDRVLSWVELARTRIAEVAAADGHESRDFACTLLVALVHETSAVFFHVGDGAIVYRADGGEYAPVFWPQSGEYANCTWFLTDAEIADRVQSATAEVVHEVALLTDGLQALALRFESREAHEPFFEPMFARLRGESEATPEGLLEELRVFLDSDAVNGRTDDDKTLVLATRLSAARGVAPEGEA